MVCNHLKEMISRMTRARIENKQAMSIRMELMRSPYKIHLAIWMARMNPRREKTELLRMRDWMEERRLRGTFVRLFSPNIYLHFCISFAEFEIPYLKLSSTYQTICVQLIHDSFKTSKST